MIDSKQVRQADTKKLPPYDPNKGCPRCGQKPRNDFPFRQAHLPVAWPALIFHNGTMHPGTELTVGPPENGSFDGPNDDARLDTMVEKGMNMDGSKRLVPYRVALDEAVTVWLNDPRARD